MVTNLEHLSVFGQSRRRFVQGLSAGAALLCMPRWAFSSTAVTLTGSPHELRGTEFDLKVAETPVNFSGRQRMATTINGSDRKSVV